MTTDPQPEVTSPDHAIEWRAVIGLEGLYSVSDTGCVRSEARVIERRDGTLCPVRQRIMKPAAGKKAKYLTVGLSREGVAINRYVAHLVLEAFAGPCPDGFEACHGDGNRQNNRRGNLRWDTKANNHADKRVHGTSADGERNPMAALTDEKVRTLRARRGTGVSYKKLAAEFGVSTMTAYRAAVGQSWSHI